MKTEVVLKLSEWKDMKLHIRSLMKTEVVLKSSYEANEVKGDKSLMKTEVVLKLLFTSFLYLLFTFNENRSCIEIYFVYTAPHMEALFNENRSCIEIIFTNKKRQ